MIGPAPEVRELILSIDRSKFRVWALTNAYVVVREIGRLVRIMNPDLI